MRDCILSDLGVVNRVTVKRDVEAKGRVLQWKFR